MNAGHGHGHDDHGHGGHSHGGHGHGEHGGAGHGGHDAHGHDAHGHDHAHDSHAAPGGGGLGESPAKKILLLLVVLAFLGWFLRYPAAPRPGTAAVAAPRFAAGEHGAGGHAAADTHGGAGDAHAAGAGAHAAGAGDHAAGAGGNAAGGHGGGDGIAVFYNLYSHVLPHPWGADEHGAIAEQDRIEFNLGGSKVTLFNIQFHQLLAVVLMLLVFGGLRLALQSGARMGWLLRVFSGFVLFIRDEMVMPVLGEHHGKKLLPYFLFVFFFVAFQNLVGLAPHGLTATACIFVTAALGITTFGAMLILGMKEQGVAEFWMHLIPPGLPKWLIPLMAVVEIIGLLVKPFALTIRLFANMMAGHLVVLSCMGLIFFFARDLGNAAYAVAVPSVGLAAFVMIIEGFVALMQAYIFTYLSILFVGACMHPEH